MASVETPWTVTSVTRVLNGGEPELPVMPQANPLPVKLPPL